MMRARAEFGGNADVKGLALNFGVTLLTRLAHGFGVTLAKWLVLTAGVTLLKGLPH